MSKYEVLFSLAEFILPASFLDYFDVVDVQTQGESLHIYLDEQKVTPDEASKAVSKGFMDEVLIRDFPIRDRKVTLHVRRRRWFDPQTNKSLSRSLHLTADGTRYTTEFADALKKIFGYLPNNRPLS